MFGTLIVVLPIPRQGGDLILRNNEKEQTLPSPPVAGGNTHPGLEYAAFTNDIAYGFAPVQVGHLVTVTYHLYFESPVMSADHTPVDVQGPLLKATCESLLAGESFLPNGGELAFRMRRVYAISNKRRTRKDLAHILGSLKGSDAALTDVCNQLDLDVNFNIVYSVDPKFEDEAIISPKLMKMDLSYPLEDDMLYAIRCKYKGRYLAGYDEMLDRDGCDEFEREMVKEKRKTNEDVSWVTPLTESLTRTQVRFGQTCYGGEVEMHNLYGRGCLIVKVGEWRNRKTVVSRSR